MTEFHVVDQLEDLNFSQGAPHEGQSAKCLSYAETEEFVLVIRHLCWAAALSVDGRP